MWRSQWSWWSWRSSFESNQKLGLMYAVKATHVAVWTRVETDVEVEVVVVSFVVVVAGPCTVLVVVTVATPGD